MRPGEALLVEAPPGAGHLDDGADTEGGGEVGHLVAPVMGRAGPVVGGGRHEHARGELAHPGRRSGRAVVRGAAGPDRPERGGAEEGDDRLRTVRQIADDPVTRAHPLLPQQGGERQRLLLQLRPGQLGPAPRLVDRDHGGAVEVSVREDLVDEVEPGALEPPLVRHRPTGQDPVVAAGGDDPEEVPHRAPVLLRVLDRPGMQARVVTQVRTAAVTDPSGELIQPGIPRLTPRHRIRDRAGPRGPVRRILWCRHRCRPPRLGPRIPEP